LSCRAVIEDRTSNLPAVDITALEQNAESARTASWPVALAGQLAFQTRRIILTSAVHPG
jgi:hypothetical protein